MGKTVRPGRRARSAPSACSCGRPRRRPRRGRRARSRSGGGRRRSAAAASASSSVTAAWIAGSATRQTPVSRCRRRRSPRPRARPRVAGLDQRPGVLGAEREDRREVVAGRAGEVEAVLLRPGQGALVGQDLCRPRSPRPGPGRGCRGGCASAPSGAGVVLGHRPDRRLGVADQGARLRARPRSSSRRARRGRRRVCCGAGLAVRFGQVDRDRVVGRALQQLAPAAAASITS